MNNRDVQQFQRDTPEREKLKQDVLDQLKTLVDGCPPESPWNIHLNVTRQHLSLTVNRNGSISRNAVFATSVQLQPYYPIPMQRERNAFFAQRLAKLEDALALVHTLVTTN